MSSFCKCKSYSHFLSKNVSEYAIFNDQGFNDTLTNDIVSFEQLCPVFLAAICNHSALFLCHIFVMLLFFLSAFAIYLNFT